MPTTPTGIWTPTDSDDWDLTTDLAAMAVSIDTAITAIPLPTRYIGTESQRLAMTAPNLRNGIEFQTTDTNLIWWRSGGAWTRSLPGKPFAFAAGSTTIPGSGEATVTLPAGRFTVAPILNLTAIAGNSGQVAVPYVGATSSQITATEFKVRIFSTGGVSVGGILHWTAVQMTNTTAAG